MDCAKSSAMEKEMQNINLLNLLLKWKFHLLVTFSVSCVIAVVFSSTFFITPRFKSVGIIYPSNIAPYSNESMTEQMIEMMKSGFVKDSMIKEFKLFERYNIGENVQDKNDQINKIYKELISIDKTEFEAVSITVFDKDPAVSKEMVEKLIYYTDVLIKKLQSQKLSEVVEMNKMGLHTVKVQLDSVNKALNMFRREYSILDYNIQLEQVSKNYYKSLASSGRGLDEMKKMLEVLKLKGSEYDFLYKRSGTLTSYYAQLETELLKSIKEYERNFTYSNIISDPIKPDKKSYPVRWIIVLSSGLSALFLGFLLILNYERKYIEM
jgi:capsule polysaccharide export protein KpsE/RkpR